MYRTIRPPNIPLLSPKVMKVTAEVQVVVLADDFAQKNRNLEGEKTLHLAAAAAAAAGTVVAVLLMTGQYEKAEEVEVVAGYSYHHIQRAYPPSSDQQIEQIDLVGNLLAAPEEVEAVVVGMELEYGLFGKWVAYLWVPRLV